MMRAPTLLAPFLSDSYFKSNPQPTYLFLQNGLNVEKDMYNAIVAKGATPKIISTALWIGTNMFNDNVVEHSHHVYISLTSVTQLYNTHRPFFFGVRNV